MRKINEIIIHCSATPRGRNTTVNDIDLWHKARGFKCIGYHYVVYLDGSVHKGREENEMGAHCIGHNANSIGVCYVGGCLDDTKMTPADTRTPSQREALKALVAQLKQKYPQAKVWGHRDFAAKACPCFDAKTEYY